MGKVVFISLIFLSFGTFGYAISSITLFVVSGDYKKYRVYRKMIKDLKDLSGHVIICGYGRVGYHAAKHFEALNYPFMVIERNPDLGVEQSNWLIADATKDENLILAGIERASALVSALPTDPENLYIVLSAKSLNPNVKVIARATDAGAQQKLHRAGADKVVLPDILGGIQMASLITNPRLTDFMDKITVLGEDESRLEEISRNELNKLPHRTIADLRQHGLFGCLIVGLGNEDGDIQVNPENDIILSDSQFIIVIGKPNQLDKLRQYIKSQQQI